MNDQELKQALRDAGLQVKRLAALDDTSPQNLYKGIKAGHYFTLERLGLLYDYLRREAPSNIEALRVVAQELTERLPALRDSDRHLVELAPTPWQRAQLVLSHPDWLAPLLQAMGHDRRPCVRDGMLVRRRLEVILPVPNAQRIQRTCTELLNLRYRLQVIRAEVPPLLPPLLILDDAIALTLGERELRPLAPAVGQRQIQALAQLLQRAEVQLQADLTGPAKGRREAAASDGQHHRAAFETPEGQRFELQLDALEDERWRLEFRALSHFNGPHRLRLIDQGGQVWLNARADHLPWQGHRAFPAQDPGPLLAGLTLEILEDDHETQA